MSKKNKPAPKSNPPAGGRTNTPQYAAAQSSTDFWSNLRLHNWLVFLLSFVLYANTLTHNYCQDDAIVITQNVFTKQGVSGISGIWDNDTFYGFYNTPGKDKLVAGGRYRPFTLVMFAFEYQIFGENPFIGHLVNVLLFGFTSVLLYRLMHKLLLYKGFEASEASKFALITALVFAAHPIHTEAVANIKGRDEIMSLLGCLAALWYSLKAYEGGGWKAQGAAFAVFFAGMASKENAITFVVIAPLVYRFFVKTSFSRMAFQTLPFLAGAAVFLLQRGRILGWSFGNVDNELLNNPYLKWVGNAYVPFDFSEKMATIVYTLGKYVQLLIFPHPLTHDYYPRHVDIMHFGDWQVIASVVLYLGLGWLILRGWRARSVLSFGILFYIITLSIVSNVVFPVGTNMAERFMFMPSVGFAIVVAYILTQVDFAKARLVPVLGALVFLLGVKTFWRNFAWKDNYTIFTTDIDTSERSAKLQCSVGGETIEKAKLDNNMVTRRAAILKAIEHEQKALAIHPTYKLPYLLMGNGYFYLNEFDKAIESYGKAVQLDANFKDARNNIQFTYREGGKFFGQNENVPKSIEWLEKAVALNPEDGEAYSYLGTAYGISGRVSDCIGAFTKALSIRPSANDALNLSVAYRQVNNLVKAQEYEAMAKQMGAKQ